MFRSLNLERLLPNDSRLRRRETFPAQLGSSWLDGSNVHLLLEIHSRQVQYWIWYWRIVRQHLELMVVTDSQIKVYVRKGAEKSERTLSFIIPTSITQEELMDDEWGIDGNQAIGVVPVGKLVERQRQMMDWFRQKGYNILFC